MTLESPNNNKDTHNAGNNTDNGNNTQDHRISSDPGVAALLELSKEIEERQQKQMQEYQERHSQDIAEKTKDGEAVDPRELRPPGILPPQAMLSTPPPPPPVLKSSEDSSSLLSPWWSEEAPLAETAATTATAANNTASLDQSSDINNMIKNNNNDDDVSGENEDNVNSKIDDKANETASQNSSQTSSQKNSNQKTNLSFTIFDRALNKKDQNIFKERCILFATTIAKSQQKEANQGEAASYNDLQDVLTRSKQCSMVCFLKFNKEVMSSSLSSTASTPASNSKATSIPTISALTDTDTTASSSPISSFLRPFDGTFITVAKTAKRCEEHIYSDNIQSKTSPDYFTINLGEEIHHSGEYVTNNVIKILTPLQTFAQKYLDSWKDGTQQKFFARFWTTVQNGDALHLVGKSTKKMIELIKEKTSRDDDNNKK
ncbi:hypothetical protein BDF20DRAFT_913070 [Mycotypha africana]|uniref:uncharacterized protein n=1 Tax=Mycotypha africana TaxID=64632 RepID=UPI002300A7E6|nr:uncharacterized protein BDF20DRAFT_913070 [Mycotypha africana]KAI8979505.1 hypothetical protein BDF20DRAFT_913070 [Mycotypha africana]